jgi:hypothetical protein
VVRAAAVGGRGRVRSRRWSRSRVGRPGRSGSGRRQLWCLAVSHRLAGLKATQPRGRRIALAPVLLIERSEEVARTMAFTRQDLRESFERAGDEHWQALNRHHTDAYPESNPTPGDVPRTEAARLNVPWLGRLPRPHLVESGVERIEPAVRITHVFRGSRQGTQFETEPFTGMSAGSALGSSCGAVLAPGSFRLYGRRGSGSGGTPRRSARRARPAGASTTWSQRVL